MADRRDKGRFIPARLLQSVLILLTLGNIPAKPYQPQMPAPSLL